MTKIKIPIPAQTFFFFFFLGQIWEGYFLWNQEVCFKMLGWFIFNLQSSCVSDGYQDQTAENTLKCHSWPCWFPMTSFAFVPWVTRVECGPFVPDTQDSVCNMDTLLCIASPVTPHYQNCAQHPRQCVQHGHITVHSQSGYPSLSKLSSEEKKNKTKQNKGII